MYVVGRQRRYLEAGFFSSSDGRVCVKVVERQRRYFEAGVFSPSGGLAQCVRSRASAWVP